MADPDPKRRLEELEARLAARRAADRGTVPPQEDHYSQAQIAWRMVTELVAGLAVGFGLGYGLDVLLGTTPWLMLVFTLLGLAAGINVMIRTAQETQTRQAARDAGPGDADGDSAPRAAEKRTDDGD